MASPVRSPTHLPAGTPEDEADWGATARGIPPLPFNTRRLYFRRHDKDSEVFRWYKIKPGRNREMTEQAWTNLMIEKGMAGRDELPELYACGRSSRPSSGGLTRRCCSASRSTSWTLRAR